MHVTYVPDNIDYWISFYKTTITSQSQYQIGGDLPAFTAYAPYHKGSGLGSFFKSLFRMAMPMLKSAGRRALISGSKIAADVAQGHSLADSVKEHGKAAAGDLMHEVADKIQGKQTGKGVGGRKKSLKKKHYKRKAKPISDSLLKKKLPKIVGSDIFSR